MQKPVTNIFHRWTILESSVPKIVPSGKVPMVKAQCACGVVQVVDPRSLKRGLSKSCGCLRDELQKLVRGAVHWKNRRAAC
jgi:hypothetical protein